MQNPRLHALLASLTLLFISYVSIGCGSGSFAAATTPSSPTTPATPAAPPVITAISPATITAGGPAFTLQITGSGFMPGSIVSWDTTALTTTYVSVTVVKALVPASLAAIAGTSAIIVANPNGQTSGSSNNSVVIGNPAPAITSVSPAFATAGASPTDVTVTGTNFLSTSVASFSGQPRATTVKSATQLIMALGAADLASPGQDNVTVTNPAPGGGASPPATFIVNPPPAITGVAPASIIVGSPDTPVTIMGMNYMPGAMVMVNGFLVTPLSVNPASVLATVPGSELGTTGFVNLSVISGGVDSNNFQVPVVNPVPVIQSISSPIVTAGSPGFSLTLEATGVVGATQVNVNGLAGPPPFSMNPIQVPIPASALAQVGTVSISLTNPSPGGGTSNIVLLKVIAGSNYLRMVNLPANALVWNPQQKVIYAAISATATSNASNVIAIDPGSGNVVASQPMPGEPTLLAISGDQQYLYVAMTATASIARLTLPALTPDIQWTVGPIPPPNDANSIFDMHVAPNLPHTIAVTQETPSQGGTSELAIYDDSVMRPNVGTALIQPSGYVNVLQWGADASTIYATESTETTGPEFLYSINAQGATLTGTNLGAINGIGFPNQLVYDHAEARLYDLGGEVVDPATGKLLGSFPTSGTAFAIDSAQHRVYFLGGTPYPDGGNVNNPNGDTQIAVYDQDHFTNEATIVLPAVVGSGTPLFNGSYLIRWGAAGLAFNIANSIYILDGPLVTPGALPSSSAGTFATPVPQLSEISPESVVAGSPDVTITLTGQNFTPATTVSWNNNNLATTVASNTEVQAVIPAAALSTPAAAPIYVQNSPGEGISNVIAFSVLPNLGPGLQITALNISGYDLAWNAVSNQLYIAVLNNDSLHPQTIATVDPAAGTLLSALPISANPYVLSIAADDQYLYAGFTNNANVQRYALPALTPDLLIPLGIGPRGGSFATGSFATGSNDSCDFAVSIAVAPGTDSTIAVTQGGPYTEPQGCGPTAVFDGATPRPLTSEIYTTTGRDFSKLTWGADATALYAQGDDCCSFQPISSLTVSSSGVVYNQSNTSDIYLRYRPHFDPGTGLIYSDGGAITQPATLAMVGDFKASGLMVPDSALGLAYFLGQTSSQIGGNYGLGNANYTLQIFNLNTYALVNSIVIPNVIGDPYQMIRWGASGIAFITQSGGAPQNNAPGLTYIISGPEISSSTPMLQTTSDIAARVKFTWKSPLQKRPSANNAH